MLKRIQINQTNVREQNFQVTPNDVFRTIVSSDSTEAESMLQGLGSTHCHTPLEICLKNHKPLCFRGPPCLDENIHGSFLCTTHRRVYAGWIGSTVVKKRRNLRK